MFCGLRGWYKDCVAGRFNAVCGFGELNCHCSIRENLTMNKNAELQKEVIAEVQAELGDAESGIGVAVDDGAVMLSGTAPTYSDKYAAERAARRIPGVRVVSEGIQVAVEARDPADNAIAKAVAHAFQNDPSVPTAVQATVERGWVTLRGEVSSTSQREAALSAVRHGAGINRVYNLITIRPAE
jgi:osmotically-inducible protein OsmY